MNISNITSITERVRWTNGPMQLSFDFPDKDWFMPQDNGFLIRDKFRVPEAARLLGETYQCIRSRIRRKKLEASVDEFGTWWVTDSRVKLRYENQQRELITNQVPLRRTGTD